jgi:undecaprenyl pyrophosphate phosphatase UppP
MNKNLTIIAIVGVFALLTFGELIKKNYYLTAVWGLLCLGCILRFVNNAKLNLLSLYVLGIGLVLTIIHVLGIFTGKPLPSTFL